MSLEEHDHHDPVDDDPGAPLPSVRRANAWFILAALITAVLAALAGEMPFHLAAWLMWLDGVFAGAVVIYWVVARHARASAQRLLDVYNTEAQAHGQTGIKSPEAILGRFRTEVLPDGLGADEWEEFVIVRLRSLGTERGDMLADEIERGRLRRQAQEGQ